MIEVNNLSKSFGDKKLFDNYSLTVEDGECVCFTGVSGRGKTTLLRLITGLEKPDGGSIKLSPETRFSFIFQEDRLIPWLTLLKNLTAVGITPERAREYLGKVNLTGEENSLPDSLSGGMARRAALARCLAAESNALYLDEPLTGQDEGTKKLLLELLKKELKGKTALIITHDDEDARFLGDRVIEL